jgi:pimeloyl-ACP methyl ester carboxylesterase
MRPDWRFTILNIAAVVAMPPFLPAQEPKLPADLKKVTVADGVVLHYVEKGKGVPVVFVHGGGGDYSEWDHHLGAFAEHYRAIAFSGRYNYPNTNKRQPNYSAVVAADDLAGLIKKLDLGKVHVVGHSLGAQTSLILAVRHPELVRTLTLSEGGVHFKGDKLPEVVLAANKRARVAFEKGNTEEALETILEVPLGGKVKINQFPEVLRERLIRNAGEIEALVNGDNFPEVDRDAVKKIAVPTLLLFGEKSAPIFKGIREELMRVLPEKNRKLVIIRDASHGLRWTHAEQYRKEVLGFLKDM